MQAFTGCQPAGPRAGGRDARVDPRLSHAQVNRGGGWTWAEGGRRVPTASCFPEAALKKPHLQRALSSFFENKMIKGYLPSHPTSDTSRAASLLSPLIMHAAFPQLPVLRGDGSYNPELKAKFITAHQSRRRASARPALSFIYRYVAGPGRAVGAGSKVFTNISPHGSVRRSGRGNAHVWGCRRVVFPPEQPVTSAGLKGRCRYTGHYD